VELAKKLKSLRIYPKLVITFLLVLSPIYYIGLQMNENGTGHVKDEIANSLKSRVNLYMEILDTDFESTIRLMQDYVNDDDLLKLSTSATIMSDIERTESILRLKKRLDLLKQSSRFVENAQAMIPAIDRTVAANVNAVTSFDHAEFEALRVNKNLYGSPFILIDNRIFLSIPYPDVNTGREPMFVLAVQVSRSELTSALGRFTNTGGGAVLSGTGTEWAIAGALEANKRELFLAHMDRISKGTSLENSEQTAPIGNETYMVVQQKSERMGLIMSMFVPSKDIDKPLQDYRKWLVILSVVSAILVLVFSYSIYRMIHQPLKTLIQAFRRLEQGHFNFTVKYVFKDEFSYLYDQLNATIRQLDVLVHEVYEQQYRARTSELKHLQSQINPHFLYNTYFLLYRMAMLKDNENIILLSKHLGEYFQYITRDGSEEVPYELEARHAKTYMDIQTIRFAERIQAEFGELPEEALSIPVPRLIIQPIIENAYKYALEQKKSDAWLQVTSALNARELVITIEDNGEELTEEKLSILKTMLSSGTDMENTGLVNVHRRLRIRYGERAGLRISRGGQGGMKAQLIIPLGEEQS
jgi:two-component system sensor histidine kinase YesM